MSIKDVWYDNSGLGGNRNRVPIKDGETISVKYDIVCGLKKFKIGMTFASCWFGAINNRVMSQEFEVPAEFRNQEAGGGE